MEKIRIAIYYIFIGSLFLLIGCREEHRIGEGLLHLKVTMDGEVNAIISRTAENITDKLNRNCHVQIRNASGGLLRDYEKLSDVPDELYFLSGDYKVEVKAGLETAATFEMPYYEGEVPFTIKSGGAETVDVPCAIQSTVVQINYSDNIKDAFKELQVAVFTSKGTLVFNSNEPNTVGYFILPSGETELNWKITAITQQNKLFEKDGHIYNAARATKYLLSLGRDEIESIEGGGALTVKVDETPLREIDGGVVIRKCPDIKSVDFNINKTLFFNKGEGKALNVSVSATSALEALILSCDLFKENGQLPLNSFNILGLADNLKDDIKNAGISCLSEYDITKNIATATLSFTSDFIQRFSDEERDFTIELFARDANQKTKSEKIHIVVSSAVALTTQIGVPDVWTYSATLRATLNQNMYNEATETISFTYWKEEDEGNKTTVIVDKGTIKEGQVQCKITGLEAQTRYYYQVMAASQQTESEVCTFFTGGASQLPNSNFERWSMNGKAWMVYGEGDTPFWDSGNVGTMNDVPLNAGANTTTNDNGTVRMETIKIKILTITKLAAGNMFAGHFVNTDVSAQTAELSFGREFKDRPVKMSFRYKYVPQVVSEFSKEGYITNGETDVAHIYIALINGAPFKIKPTGEMFDKNDNRVIAYKEFTTSETVADFTTKEIELDYIKKEVLPTHILVVATSSKYGDYFAGAVGSTLWLDDVNLIYE